VAGRSESGDRGDVDDRAATAVGHRSEGELGGEHDCPQVQVKGVLPFRRLRGGEARALDASGVVNQDADPAGQPAGGIDGGADTGPGGDIGAHE
jgi:hypothetical protein